MQSGCQPVAVAQIKEVLIRSRRHEALEPLTEFEKAQQAQPFQTVERRGLPRLLDPEKAGQFGVDALKDHSGTTGCPLAATKRPWSNTVLVDGPRARLVA
jgi:hypothetical protein